MKFSFSLFGRRYILSALSIKKPNTWTTGLTSRVPGTTFHVLLMDYDIIRKDYLFEELAFLQETFNLGDFYVFQTRLEEEKGKPFGFEGEEVEGVDIGGYHAICLDTRTTRESIMILKCTNCDYSFVNAPSYNPEKHWVLRVAKKGERDAPKYIETLSSPYEGKNGRLQSTFHARLLDDLYDLGIEERLVNPDGNEIGVIDHYNTAKRV